MNPAVFDPAGPPLWVKMDMKGLYTITYVCQLIDTDDHPPTRPLLTGNNKRSDDDCFPVKNDLADEGTSPAVHDGRSVEVSFDISQIRDDAGYRVKMLVLQGHSEVGSIIIGKAEAGGKTGPDGVAEEHLSITLQKR